MRSEYTIDPYYDSPDWRILREKVLKRDQRTCRYCHGPAHQADHVIPRKCGGKDQMKNLVACCATCNKTAGNHQFKTFADKKKWVLANRLPEEERILIPHTGRRPKKAEYPTKPTKAKSAFRLKLEARNKSHPPG